MIRYIYARTLRVLLYFHVLPNVPHVPHTIIYITAFGQCFLPDRSNIFIDVIGHHFQHPIFFHRKDMFFHALTICRAQNYNIKSCLSMFKTDCKKKFDTEYQFVTMSFYNYLAKGPKNNQKLSSLLGITPI